MRTTVCWSVGLVLVLAAMGSSGQIVTNSVTFSVPSYNAELFLPHSQPTWITGIRCDLPPLPAGAVRTKLMLSGTVDDFYYVGGHAYQYSQGAKSFTDDITSSVSADEQYFYVILYDWYNNLPNWASFSAQCTMTYVYPSATFPSPQEGLLGTKEPINMQSGDLYFNEADIAVPCPGLPLQFGRRYDSLSKETNSLGAGWTHSFEWRVDTTNTPLPWRVVKAADGQTYLFSMSTDGTTGACYENNWRLSMANERATLGLPGGLFYAFETNGSLSTISNLWGRRLTCTYTNAAGTSRLSRVTHDSGQAFDMTYTNGRLVRVQASTNLFMSYAYDAQGHLTNAVRWVSGDAAATRYAYGTCLTQKVDAVGAKFSYAYDGNGRATGVSVNTNFYKHTVEYASAYHSHVTYDRGPDTTAVWAYFTGPGKRVDYTYFGEPSNYNYTYYQYDSAGNTYIELANEKLSANQNIYHMRWFNDQHCVTNYTYWFGGEGRSVLWSLSWDSALRMPTGSTDPEGCRQGVEYTNGAPVRIRAFRDETQSFDTTFTYETNGLLLTVTNANGHGTAFQYDAGGYLAREVPAVGPPVAYSNNALGYVERVTLPGRSGDRVTVLERDALGLVKRIVWPDQVTERYAYDRLGSPTNYIDRAGRATRLEYLPTGKLGAVTPLSVGTNPAIRIEYDNQFNVIRVRDAKGRVPESYQWDFKDRLASVTNLEGQTMTVGYYVENIVDWVRRFDGTLVSNVLNTAGLPSEVRFHDATNRFTYYRNNILKTATSESCMVSNTINVLNQTTEVRVTGVPGAPWVAGYTYYPAGQVSNTVTVAGTNAYTLDSADRVVGLAARPAGFTFTYDTNNGLLATAACTETGLTADYGYDDLDQLTNLVWRTAAGEMVRQFAYAHNAVGMITNVAREIGSSVSYTYDNLDQLTAERRTSGGVLDYQAGYAYDAVGNRTNKTQEGIAVIYAYSNGCDRLTGWASVSTNAFASILHMGIRGGSSEVIGTNTAFGQRWVSNGISVVPPVVAGTEFGVPDVALALGTQCVVAAVSDAAGNVGYATSTVTVAAFTNGSFGYSIAGCVTNIRMSGFGVSRELGLTWDGQYRLTAVTTNASGAPLERYGYDALGSPLWTWTAEEGTNWHVYDGPHVVADLNATGGVVRTYVWAPGIDQLLCMTVHTGGTVATYYAIRDLLGSVHALVDADGAVAESYEFDAWGRVRSVRDGHNLPLRRSALGNRYLWQGREYSWQTGLYNFRARWYDPITGRWLSNDPLGIAGGLNQYVFCGNNPVNFRDPMGTCKTQEKAVEKSLRDYGFSFNPSSIIPGTPGFAYVTGVPLFTSGWERVTSIHTKSGYGWQPTNDIPGMPGYRVKYYPDDTDRSGRNTIAVTKDTHGISHILDGIMYRLFDQHDLNLKHAKHVLGSPNE